MSLLMISGAESDFSRLLTRSIPDCHRVVPSRICEMDLDAYDAFAILGGTDRKATLLFAPDRDALGQQLKKGKRIFSEFCRGIGQIACLETVSTRYERPVLPERHEVANDLEPGTIFDEQCNERLIVYRLLNRTHPILQYVRNPEGFYKVENIEEIKPDVSKFALWLDEPNLMFCSLRICNFAKAKFAPQKAWAGLLSGIVNWLGGRCEPETVIDMFRSEYTLGGGLAGDYRDMVGRAMDWFENAGMLVSYKGAPYAVKEGLMPPVYADGTHVIGEELRHDCVGETAYMYFLKYMLTRDPKALEIADGLYRMPLDMQITESCPHKGMVRGSLSCWWKVSYHHDTTRGFLYPLLWRSFFSGTKRYIPRIKDTLDYLANSTGTDGIRPDRIDFNDMYSPEISASAYTIEEHDGVKKWIWGGESRKTTLEELRTHPGADYGVSGNLSYSSALLLGYQLTGEERYYSLGLKGIETTMNRYPDIARGGSETSSLCSLILPLAITYWVTGEEKHKKWLYDVTGDLQRLRYEKGGYLEWDTGYAGSSSRVKDEESSLFYNNGDPVVDMLYSVNWLPQGFIIAYYVTGDSYFKKLWEDIVNFFAKAQVRSDNKRIDGAWPRAIDVQNMEVYGMPNDIGWAPWSVETGWSMSVITAGIILGLLEDEISVRFQS